MSTPISIVLQAKSAINLSDLSASGSGAVQVKGLQAGAYSVTLKNDTMQFRSGIKVNQIIIFNTSPVTTGDYIRWYYLVNTVEGIVMNYDGSGSVYVFIVDHGTVADNTGSVTVNFSLVPS
ncbi:hypothetical protein [Azospirillum sp. B4]|uniref:hypothetical protein n=1 Tax=Azospirillum sp. B4 TaxID=95605 RepID=UPI000347D2D6|nr:hypothetical protein [Azospirillum sp. B4]